MVAPPRPRPRPRPPPHHSKKSPAKGLHKKEFKTKKPNDISNALLEDDVPDFPRGGASLLSRREQHQVRDEVDAEFESDELRNNKKKKNKSKNLTKKKQDAADDDLGSLFGDSITGKLPRFANRITLKNISPGMKLWGVIVELNEKDVVISLPGGLRGLVLASEALDPVLNVNAKAAKLFPSMFHVGQLVGCIVLKLDDDKRGKGNRKIWLSMRLSLLHKGLNFDAVQEGMVLTAYVKSIEDHGYILDFGLPSFTGFLPKSDLPDCEDNKLNAKPLLQGIVRSIDKARRVVHLSWEADIVSKCVTKDVKGISIDLLVPGMMVTARVRSILENGVMLSFLTYFTGTVDLFHLQNLLPSANWKDEYIQNKKVNARILFVDPSTRAIGLTMNPHLVHNKAPPSHIKTGDIYDYSKVIRVDKGIGLLLEVPSSPASTPAYVGIHDVADKEVKNIEKKFKEGSQVCTRILGFRHLEGLAIGTLKESALEGSVFTHSDVKPGMVVKAKVIVVDSFGAIVQLSSGVKALCPLPHMSELELSKPPKKFKVGDELVFRVLGCKSKRITVTHKKTLVKSKLGTLCSYADASEGLVTHGWITKIEKHGCFVKFYNGVQGFVARSELGLEPGSDASSSYHVGQVVKCRVIGSVPSSRRINLSFIIKPRSVPEGDMVKLGSLVSGVVERVTTNAVAVSVNAKGYLKGTIPLEHLSDHHGLANLMKSVVKPGYQFEELLVLDIEGNNLILTAKHSLISSAQQLPQEHTQIRPNSVIHGYICNMIETGCFVRFLGHLTGFSPRKKAMDEQMVDLSDAFYIGQSVRSNILNVTDDTGRISLSLRLSSCSSTDASFVNEYFLMDERIAKLQFSDPKGPNLEWTEDFCIGKVVEGRIHEVKDFGVVVSFQKHVDVYGFIPHYQLSGKAAVTGSVVQAAVLDIVKTERLVDLSIKPEFLDQFKKEISTRRNHKKKRTREAVKDLELHQTVNAVVEIVKENYLVLSIPDCDFSVGFASINDYNSQKLPPKQFIHGQSVSATIMALPSSSTTGRLLLLLNSINDSLETSSSKKAKRKSSYDIGSLVQAEITEIKPLELRLKFGIGFRGRIHITETCDKELVENPLNNFRVGQTLTAKIIANANRVESKGKSHLWELSIKPSTLSGSEEAGDTRLTEEPHFSAGQFVTGYVNKVDNEWVWLTLSRHVNAQLFCLDSASEPTQLEDFQKRFTVGKVVSGYVLSMNKDKRLLRLVLHPLRSISDVLPDGKVSASGEEHILKDNVISHIRNGDIVGGKISKILPGVGGVLVQLGPHLYGKVHYTELRDSWVYEPLSGYHEGQFVRCKILEINCSVGGAVHIDLSLRSSLVGLTDEDPVENLNDVQSVCIRPQKIGDLHPKLTVQGYVKNVMSKGCFIMLSWKLDAKILLSNLSDGFVEDLGKEFPVGKLVTGRVVSTEPLSGRVEVTLKTPGASSTSKFDINDLSSMHVGDLICGRIKRVEPYGVFITIEHSNIVGLCHVSELLDEDIDSIETKFKAGDTVRAKILKVDKERHRISLGMKGSYFGDTDVLRQSLERTEKPIHEEASIGDKKLTSFLGCGVTFSDMEFSNEQCPIPAEVESRASVPPLDVTLDDFEMSDVDNTATQTEENVDRVDAVDDKEKKRARRKAKAEREEEIRAKEEKLLERDRPRTTDDFEKLVRSSPNSSFVWIKYMAFLLSLGDVEKARSVAERALRTINFREESEKLNVWVAYFNLENEYGNPPEEAVGKIFQRALQYCDPERVHLELLDMYERTEQHKSADQLLDKMTRKFRQSCEVWLRRIKWLLNQRDDGVQSVVNRALLSLPRDKHIEFISQTAISEFKFGVPDRGRSLFEGILREYPKRTDLWSVYIDQEIRLGDVDLIRSLFERATSLSLPLKKMKFLFSKYLEYEKGIGDEDRIDHVKRKAMEYAQDHLND